MAVTLALAKQHLRALNDRENDLIEHYLAAAKAWVEHHTGKKLIRGPVEQREQAFGSYVPLLWGPSPEGVSVAYVDGSGAPQTFTDARLVRDRLYSPAAGWPSITANTPIVLTYTAGFTDTPADLDAAVLLLVADFFTNRESGNATPATTAAVQALCSPYRAVLV
jgi:uncharacterized phiE125 gp8 family phage protein